MPEGDFQPTIYDRVFAMLEGFAARGKPAPTNGDIALVLGVSRRTVDNYLKRMVRRNVVSTEFVGPTRRICVGGKWTGWSYDGVYRRRDAAVLAIITKAAAAGERSPTVGRIARDLACSDKGIRNTISRLVAAGEISIETYKQCGSVRRFTVERTGARTDWTWRILDDA